MSGSYEQRKRDLMRGYIRVHAPAKDNSSSSKSQPATVASSSSSSSSTTVATPGELIPRPVSSSVKQQRQRALPRHTVLIFDLDSWCKLTYSTVVALVEASRGNLIVIPELVIHQFDERKAIARRRLDALRALAKASPSSTEAEEWRNDDDDDDRGRRQPKLPAPSRQRLFLTQAEKMELAEFQQQLFLLRGVQSLFLKLTGIPAESSNRLSSIVSGTTATAEDGQERPLMDGVITTPAGPSRIRVTEAALFSLRQKQAGISKRVRMQQRCTQPQQRVFVTTTGPVTATSTTPEVEGERDRSYVTRACVSNYDSRQIIACALYYLRNHVLTTTDNATTDQGSLLRGQIEALKGQFFERCMIVSSNAELKEYTTLWNTKRMTLYDEPRPLRLEFESLEEVLDLVDDNNTRQQQQQQQSHRQSSTSVRDKRPREDQEVEEEHKDNQEEEEGRASAVERLLLPSLADSDRWLFEDVIGVELEGAVAQEDRSLASLSSADQSLAVANVTQE